MVGLQKVAELMEQHIFYRCFRRCEKPGVQRDLPLPRLTASPTAFHAAKRNFRKRQAGEVLFAKGPAKRRGHALPLPPAESGQGFLFLLPLGALSAIKKNRLPAYFRPQLFPRQKVQGIGSPQEGKALSFFQPLQRPLFLQPLLRLQNKIGPQAEKVLDHRQRYPRMRGHMDAAVGSHPQVQIFHLFSL